MSEISTGLRAVLTNSTIYEALQKITGANRGRRQFVDRYVRPKPNDRILDIGCGPASLLPYLPEGVYYVGYDPSPAYIATAEQKYGGRGQFFAKLFTEPELHGHKPFDIAIASSVLHHMSDDEAKEMFSLLSVALKPGGRVVTIDPSFVKGQNPIARKLISMDRGQNVRFPEAYAALPAQSFANISGEVSNLSRMPYNHWIMECAQPRHGNVMQ